tara:strand:- start:828 stop:1154 length:327 start_codon:yes stop_codon:yes gene_type:complete
MPQKKIKKAIKSKAKAIKRRLDTTDEALAYERGLVHKANNPKLAKKYIKSRVLQGVGMGAIAGAQSQVPRASAKKRGQYALGGAVVGGISEYLSAKKVMKKRKKKKKK